MDDLPDHILIETSGLALPKPLLKAFDWPQIRSKITVDGVIALADAEAVAAGRFASNIEAVEAQRQADDSLDHDTPLAEVFEDQITCADIILLTKCDLVSDEQRAIAKDIIHTLMAKKVPLIDIAEGNIDSRLILGLEAAAEDDLATRPSHHDGHDDHEHEDFETIALALPEYENIEELEKLLHKVIRECHILRAKGYIAITGKPMRLLVQAVGERIRCQFDTPWGAQPPQSQLVLIAEHDDMDESKIRTLFGV